MSLVLLLQFSPRSISHFPNFNKFFFLLGGGRKESKINIKRVSDNWNEAYISWEIYAATLTLLSMAIFSILEDARRRHLRNMFPSRYTGPPINCRRYRGTWSAMHTLVAPSILGLFWEETLSNFGGVRYRSGSLRAKWSPGEPCGDKGIGSYVVDSGQAKARVMVAMRGGGGSRTPEVQYCWSQSSSCRFVLWTAKAPVRLKGRANANVWISIRQHEPGSKSRHNEHEWVAASPW